MDPLSGSLLASFRFNQAETGNSMELVEIGAEHVLVVGTSSSNSVQGRIFVFRLEQMQTMERASTRYSSREQLNEACSLKLVCSETWEGEIEICGLLDQYFVASCATDFYVCGFTDGNSPKIKRLATGFYCDTIVKLTSHSNIIAYIDDKGSVNICLYQEDSKELRPTDSTPCYGTVLTDCLMGEEGTAIVLAILSNLTQPRGDFSTSNMVKSSFFIGEKAIRILKGSFPKLSVEGPTRVNFLASTEKGSVIEFIPLTREETFCMFPLLGQSLVEYHSRNNWPSSLKILDGDMLSQFFQLAVTEQDNILEGILARDAVKQLLQRVFFEFSSWMK